MTGTTSPFGSHPKQAAPTAERRTQLPAILMALVTIAIVVLVWTGSTRPFVQGYDPFGHWWLSTICAALPVVVLLGSLAIFRMKAHYSAFLGLVTAIVIATGLFHMPVKMAGITAIYGACYGLFPIGWIILNVIFLYRMTLVTGRFKVLQESMIGITQDTRLQLLLIAFSFGAFFEGASGFGTPVAVTASTAHWSRLPATAGIRAIANRQHRTSGVWSAWHAHRSSRRSHRLQRSCSRGSGRSHPAILLRACTVLARMGLCRIQRDEGNLVGHRRSRYHLRHPAILSFQLPRSVVNGHHCGPVLDGLPHRVPEGLAPQEAFGDTGDIRKVSSAAARGAHGYSRREVVRAWLPWIVLSVIVFLLGHLYRQEDHEHPGKVFPATRSWHTSPSSITNPQIPVTGLNKMVQRVPPVVAKPTAEAAVFGLNWLSATGSGILVAAIISGFIMRLSLSRMVGMWWQTVWHLRFSLMTIAAMLSLGILTRYSGVDATMGLAFARTGHLYPFFGTLLGWLGVALTGSDTASNVLFGSLQKISAQQIGISPS